MKANLVYYNGAILGEGPHYDEAANAFYWVDIYGETVNRLDLTTNENRAWRMGERVGAAIPATDGSIAAACRTAIYRLDPDTGEKTIIDEPEAGRDDVRFNDAKCDFTGRLYAGTMSYSEQPEGKGVLYALDADGSCTARARDFDLSNGLGFSPDGGTMYFVDTPKRVIYAFDIDMRTGALANQRVFMKMPDALRGNPDGMCVDAAGRLWVALWNGWGVNCYDPETKELLYRVDTPCAKASSCCFGGEGMRTLYITSAKPDASDIAEQPHAGGIFACTFPEEMGIVGQRCVPYGN